VTLDIHGGAYIWLYAPLLDGGKADFSLYSASLGIDANYRAVDVSGTAVRTGFHFQPAFRDTKLRPYYGSNIWVQEAYVHADFGAVVVKAGKVYTHFGKFWDGSFYGNLPYFDGLKLSADFGVSAEIAAMQKEKLKVNAYAQFFVNDGVTNGSLNGRDTVSMPGSRKRNEVIARFEPSYAFSKDGSVTFGLSAQHFKADLLEDPVAMRFATPGVTRLGGDVTLSPAKGLSIYGDYAYQKGRHIVAPAMGAVSRKNHYLLAGAQYGAGRVTGRFNLSYIKYADTSVTEILYQPGLTVMVNDHLSVIGEYVYWTQTAGGMTAKFDNSINVILSPSF
jgi:hypothetical protein